MDMQRLLDVTPRPGVVAWIGVRPQRRAPVSSLEAVQAVFGQGLEGDHFPGGGEGKRQVTLIQAEHIPAIASFLGRDGLDPALLRRNIVVRGVNLLALKDRRFRVGEALLEMTGLCQPCARMEEVLGAAGYHAMRGHGGITARIVEGGTIRIGDPVAVDSPAAAAAEAGD
jgi:MOSC domain-containing protein YiiM